jgi:pimeloyl-ACP methyl ester carboxylesterase
VRRVSLTLVAKILPVLGGVAIAMYMSWCMAISMVRGPIPLVGWTLEGGFWTFLLWGLVHGGYLAAVDLLWNDVSAAVRQLRDREQKLLLTGHSMGGALAVLAAARLRGGGHDTGRVDLHVRSTCCCRAGLFKRSSALAPARMLARP